MTIFMKARRDNKGMTLIEVMVAGTILAITLGLVIGGFQQIKKRQRYTATKQMQMWAMYHLVEEVKADIATTTGVQEYTLDDSLSTFQGIVEAERPNYNTMKSSGTIRYWSHKKIVNDKALCSNCKGVMVWQVYPLKDFPGFVLNIGISHPEIFMQDEDSNDVVVYRQFILGSD